MITSQVKTRTVEAHKINARKISTLGVALFLSAAIAAPVFAEGTAPRHARAYAQSNFEQRDRALEDIAPLPREGRTNLQNFGFSGRCPSCVGGEDPSLNPPS